MAIQMKQGLKQSQSLLLSPQIQQAIKILLLSRQELETMINDELRDNPVLEEGESNLELPELGNLSSEESLSDLKDGHDLIAQQATALEGSEDFRGLDDLFNYDSLSHADEYNKERTSENEQPGYEIVDVNKTSLFEEIENQIMMMKLSEAEQNNAILLLQYCNDDGYIATPLLEIAEENSVDLSELEFALKVLHRCEPIGLGARNLQECLLLQLDNISKVPNFSQRILQDYWTEFEKQDALKISKLMKITLDEVKHVFRFIKHNLDPRPARQFGGSQNIAITPDVFVFKRDAEWVVSINEDGLPRLRISKQYESLIAEIIQTKAAPGVEPDGKLKAFLVDNCKNARWIMKALAERNKTILRVTEIIVAKQHDFFEQGLEHLHPLTLKVIADALGLHESTISRSTSNKYLHCSRGVFELKYFFNAGLSCTNADDASNETVKMWVAEYIKSEKLGQVYSDQDLVLKIEQEKKVTIARRTIAKYREMLGILPSSKRAKLLRSD